jgi:hypothetical protein
MTSTTSTTSHLAAAMHRALISYVAAVWPDYPIDESSGAMQNLLPGRGLKIEPITDVVVDLPPPPAPAAAAAATSLFDNKSSSLLNPTVPPSGDNTNNMHTHILGVKITAYPINNHHEKLWNLKHINSPSALQLSSVRPPPLINTGIVVSYFESVPERRAVLRNVVAYDPLELAKLRDRDGRPERMGVALLLRVQSSLIQGLHLFMDALLDLSTDESHEFVAAIVRECTPLFKGNMELLPSGAMRFRIASAPGLSSLINTNTNDQQQKFLTAAEIGVTATNTIQLRVPRSTCSDSDYLRQHLKGVLTPADFAALSIVSPMREGTVAFHAPLSVDELLLLHRAVMALLQQQAKLSL